MLEDGDLLRLNPETHPNCYLHRSHPSDVARVEHLTFVCTPREGRRRTEQPLDGAGRGAPPDRCAVRRLHARTHALCRAVLHGPVDSRLLALRCRDHRQPLRRAEHGRHDPHGPAALRPHRARGQLRQGPAFDGRSRPRAPFHHAFPRRARRSRASAPATAATRCSARSVMRCASRAGRRAPRAGSRSTC